MRTLNRRARAAAFVLPVLLVASAGCDIALADLKQKETAEWRKSYELQPGGHVEISNINGKIEVEPAAGNMVEVTALKSARGASSEAARQALDRIEIQESVSPADIRIQTRIQRGSSIFNGGNLQVEYTVRVPVGADVKFSTVNGGIEISGLQGRINVETTNGGIKARDVSGPIEASTTNGGVEVDLAQLTEPGVKLGCTNGGIQLRLPADAKATITARVTNGGIDTSGLQLETSESSRRRLDGRLNGGGTRISIEGTNGGIRISGR
jgi:bifunctional DNA-binding transcriptional regulator/antitoxin component of YhaV-PrlF toxin-antitoxin module